MTFAEEIIQHCQQPSGPAMSAIMGTTLPFRDLIKDYVGKRVQVMDGVDVYIPNSCTWQTADRANGSVQMVFGGPLLPQVYATKGPITVGPEITMLVVRITSQAVEITASPKLGHLPLPDYEVRIQLV